MNSLSSSVKKVKTIFVCALRWLLYIPQNLSNVLQKTPEAQCKCVDWSSNSQSFVFCMETQESQCCLQDVENEAFDFIDEAIQS